MGKTPRQNFTIYRTSSGHVNCCNYSCHYIKTVTERVRSEHDFTMLHCAGFRPQYWCWKQLSLDATTSKCMPQMQRCLTVTLTF